VTAPTPLAPSTRPVGSAVPAGSDAVVGTRAAGQADAIVGGSSERLDERVVKDLSQGLEACASAVAIRYVA